MDNSEMLVANVQVVVHEILELAAEQKRIAENRKTTVAGISIAWAQYNAYVRSAQYACQAVGLRASVIAAEIGLTMVYDTPQPVRLAVRRTAQ